MAKNDNRCWPGYEPVPGKKEHEQGSCRKKAASKSSPSEKAFQQKRKKQLDKWEKEHPHARRSAAQHLQAPDEKPKPRKRAAGKKTRSKTTT